jgi:hypothetical protein
MGNAADRVRGDWVHGLSQKALQLPEARLRHGVIASRITPFDPPDPGSLTVNVPAVGIGSLVCIQP